jgi:hypothetical protein
MRPLAPPRRLQGVSTLGDVLRLLGTAENQRPVSARELEDLKRRYDVTMIRKPPPVLPGASAAELAPTAPLIAAVLAGHVSRLEMTDAGAGAGAFWLLLREPTPSPSPSGSAGAPASDAVPLREAFGSASSPAASARLLTSALRAMVALHERGVVLNEGARAALQMVAGSRIQVGWHTDWATVFGRRGGGAGAAEEPLVICATDEDEGEKRLGGACDVYPARDLLWLLSDAPRETQRLAGSVVTCLVVSGDGGGSSPSSALCALVPLSELHEGPMASSLPKRWQACATPVGGAGVVGGPRQGMLHRAAWAIQKVAAAALAVHDNGSAWAREDLRAAVQELWREAELRSRAGMVVRGIGSRPVVVLVGDAQGAGDAGLPDAVQVRYEGPLPETQLPRAISVASVPLPPAPLAALVREAQGEAEAEEGGLGRLGESGPSKLLVDVLEFFGSIDAPEEDESEAA